MTIPVEGKTISVTCSIGGAYKTADDTVETLMKRADEALYKVKEAGRNGVVVTA